MLFLLAPSSLSALSSRLLFFQQSTNMSKRHHTGGNKGKAALALAAMGTAPASGQSASCAGGATATSHTGQVLSTNAQMAHANREYASHTQIAVEI